MLPYPARCTNQNCLRTFLDDDTTEICLECLSPVDLLVGWSSDGKGAAVEPLIPHTKKFIES